jgi:hypothetical protein
MASLKKIENSVSGFAANLRNWLLPTNLAIGAIRATLAPVVSLATEFAKMGDEVGKMSKRFGIGAHDLSLLGHAAELSGSSLADLGNSMKFFHKNLAAAGRGDNAAVEAFERLGINIEKLQKLDTQKQFLVTAEAIKRLGDETLQTDAAMKIFGRSGTSLLPMFQEGIDGIKDKMKEAELKGIGISDEDAAKAERLTDSMTQLSRSMQGVRMSFTSAFADDIANCFDWITKITSGIREWIKEHTGLVRTLTAVGGSLVAYKGITTTIGFLRKGFAALLPVSSALVASEQANVVATNSATAAITAETQALVCRIWYGIQCSIFSPSGRVSFALLMAYSIASR